MLLNLSQMRDENDTGRVHHKPQEEHNFKYWHSSEEVKEFIQDLMAKKSPYAAPVLCTWKSAVL